MLILHFLQHMETASNKIELISASHSKPREQRNTMYSGVQTSYLTISPKLLVHFKLALATVICASISFSSAATEVTVWTEEELNAGRAAALARHNLYRCQHGASPLTLDPELNKIAQAYAGKFGSKLEILPSDAPGLGENLALFYTNSTERQDATKHLEKAVDDWYNEKKNYKGLWTSSPVVGHFTQLVWKATTSVGLGIATALRNQDGVTFQDVRVVANYKPRGNMDVETDELPKNVQAKPGNANHCEKKKASDATEVTVWTEQELNAGRDAALARHNLYRCQHGAPPLTLDSELNQIAQAYAEKSVSKGKLEIVASDAPGVGENLALFYTNSSERQDATEHLEKAVDDWYNERKNYKGRWTSSPVVGHFTQLVWKETTSVGLGIATALRAQDGMTLQDVHVVANYKPRGNMDVETDKLHQNVQAEPGNANQCETN